MKKLLIMNLILMIALFVSIRTESLFAPSQVIYINVLDIGRCLYFMLVLLLIIPFIVSYDYYIAMQNGSLHHIIYRIGYRKFYQKALIDIVLTTIIFMILVHISMWLVILFTSGDHLIGAVNASDVSLLMYFNTQNVILNNILLVLSSAIGSAILSCFMLGIGHFIKNKYVFVSIPLILVFSLTIALVLVVVPFINSSNPEFNQNYKLLTVLFSILPIGLISPGSMYSAYGLMNITISGLSYLLITIILVFFGIKHQTKRNKLFSIGVKEKNV